MRKLQQKSGMKLIAQTKEKRKTYCLKKKVLESLLNAQ